MTTTVRVGRYHAKREDLREMGLDAALLAALVRPTMRRLRADYYRDRWVSATFDGEHCIGNTYSVMYLRASRAEPGSDVVLHEETVFVPVEMVNALDDILAREASHVHLCR